MRDVIPIGMEVCSPLITVTVAAGNLKNEAVFILAGMIQYIEKYFVWRPD